MRPCRKCAFALENSFVICPRCKTDQREPAKPPPADSPPEVRPVRQAMFDLAELPTFTGGPEDLLALPVFLFVGLILFGLPLAVGGTIGYWVGDIVGAYVGVIGTAVLIVAVKAWREERAKSRPKTGG